MVTPTQAPVPRPGQPTPIPRPERELVRPRPPVAQPPRPFPGVQMLAKEEEQRLLNAQERLRLLPDKIEQLRQQVFEHRIAPLAQGLRAIGLDPSKVGIGKIQLVKEKEQAIRDEVAEFAALEDVELETIRSALWRGGVLAILPAALSDRTIEIDTLEDIVALVPGKVVGDADQEFVRNLLDELRPAAQELIAQNGAEPITAEKSQEFFRLLQTKRGSGQTLYDYDPNSMTVQEILGSVRTVSRFALPVGYETEEGMAMLTEHGLSTEEAREREVELKPQIDLLIAGMRADDAKLATLQEDAAAFGAEDILSQVDAARWSRALMEPMTIAFKPLEYYQKKWSQPLAGGALIAVSKILPGQQDIEVLFELGLGRGMSAWEAQAWAFENWEANGILKLGIEILADPTTWFGLGVYTRIASLAPKIGRFSFGGAVGAAEKGWVRAAEYPFDLAKQAWTRYVPKTLTLRATGYSRVAVDLARAAATRAYHKPLSIITKDELRTTGADAIATALRQPQSPDELTKFGLMLLGERSIGFREVKNLMDQLGSKVELTVERLAHINDEFGLLRGFGSTDILYPEESAKRLLAILDPDFLEDGTKLRTVQGFMETVKTGLENRALAKLQGETTLRILANIMDVSKQEFLDAQRSVIANNRFQQGIHARSLNNLDRVTRALFIHGIEAWITQPLARSYLITAFYGPMNILEVGLKSVLAGVNPTKGGPQVYENIAIHTSGLTGHVPSEMLEKVGMTLELSQIPEDAVRRAIPGQKLTARQRRRAQRDTSNWAMQVMTGRWLKHIIGADLETITGSRLSRRIIGALEAGYYQGMFQKKFVEKVPLQVEAAAQITKRVTVGFDDVMTPKFAAAFRQRISNSLMTGDRELLRNSVRQFTPGRLRAHEFEEELDKMFLIAGDLKDDMLEGLRTNAAWTKSETGITERFDNFYKRTIMELQLTSPEWFKLRIAELTDEALTKPLLTINDVEAQMQTITQSMDAYTDTTHTTLRMAQAHGETLTDVDEKQIWYDYIWNNRISPHITNSANTLRTLISDMKKKLNVDKVVSELPASRRQAYIDLLDKELETTLVAQTAIEEQRRIETAFITTHGGSTRGWKKKTWDEFYADRSRAWDNSRTKYLMARNDIAALTATIEGFDVPINLERVVGPLVPTDVAKLFNISPAEMQRNLYLPELLVMRSKDDFVALTRGRAELAAQRLQTTADQLGYTEQALDDIYEQMMAPLFNSSSMTEAISPIMIEMETARDIMIRQRHTSGAIMSEEGIRALEEAILGRAAVAGKSGVADHALGKRLHTQDDIDILNAEIERRRTLVIDPNLERARQAGIDDLIETRDAIIPGKTLQTDITRLDDLMQRAENLAQRTDIPIAGEDSLDTLRNKWIGLNDANVTPEIKNDVMQRFGQRAEANTAYKAGIRADLRAELGEYFKIHRGTGDPKYSPLEGREFVNVSSDLIEATKFQRSRWVGPKLTTDPELTDIVVHVDDVVAISSVGESELIIPVDVLRDRIANPLIIPDTPAQPAIVSKLDDFIAHGQGDELYDDFVKLFTPEHQVNREAILSDVNKNFGQDFPDWNNATAVTSLIKTVDPFFTYQAHRWFWWTPREFLRHPGTYVSMGKYRDYTEKGSIRIPGTNLLGSPMRGSIFMGAYSRLSKRDYPEFYDQFGWVAEAMDAAERYGFYTVGVPQLVLTTFGAKNGKTQWGEVAAPWQRTLIGALKSAFPDSKAVATLTEMIASDRYIDFITAIKVTDLGYEGVKIYHKKLRNEPLTEEEEAQWMQGNREIGNFMMINEQTSMFTWNSAKREAVQRQVDVVLSEYSGIDVSILRDMRKSGLRFQDVFKTVPPEVRYSIMAIEGMSRYSGAGVGLAPSGLQAEQLLLRKYWNNVADERLRERKKLENVERLMLQGAMTMDDWLQAEKDGKEHMANFIESERAKEEFENMPLKLADRMAFAEKNKMLPPMFDEMDQLRELWFSEPLEVEYNFETGFYEPNYDKYYAFQSAIEQSLPEDIARRLIELNHRDYTELQNTRYEVYKELFRPYSELFDIVLEEFPPEEQRLIKVFRKADAIEGARIRAELTSIAPDQLLIAEFTKRLQLAHSNLRTINPELDAWLNIFRKVGRPGNFKTEAAKRLFITFQTRVQKELASTG